MASSAWTPLTGCSLPWESSIEFTACPVKDRDDFVLAVIDGKVSVPEGRQGMGDLAGHQTRRDRIRLQVEGGDARLCEK